MATALDSRAPADAIALAACTDIRMPATRGHCDTWRGPPEISRVGSVTIARNNSNTPPTTIPNKRNGSNNNQTNGYMSKASSASGQEIARSMSHRRNLSMIGPRSLSFARQREACRQTASH